MHQIEDFEEESRFRADEQTPEGVSPPKPV